MDYEGYFWFGEPAQRIQVIFDSGSASTWVFSENCGVQDQTCPLRNTRFLQSQSKKFKINSNTI